MGDMCAFAMFCAHSLYFVIFACLLVGLFVCLTLSFSFKPLSWNSYRYIKHIAQPLTNCDESGNARKLNEASNERSEQASERTSEWVNLVAPLCVILLLFCVVVGSPSDRHTRFEPFSNFRHLFSVGIKLSTVSIVHCTIVRMFRMRV